jgi:hypothetical protein
MVRALPEKLRHVPEQFRQLPEEFRRVPESFRQTESVARRRAAAKIFPKIFMRLLPRFKWNGFQKSSRNLGGLNLECADVSALWNDATCRVVGKRRHVAALQIKALPGIGQRPNLNLDGAGSGIVWSADGLRPQRVWRRKQPADFKSSLVSPAANRDGSRSNRCKPCHHRSGLNAALRKSGRCRPVQWLA